SSRNDRYFAHCGCPLRLRRTAANPPTAVAASRASSRNFACFAVARRIRLKPSAMYRNIFLVGGWTIASRLTGFLRDMALAALLGGGALNDAYVAAIKLPNQFRQIFGEGSFNAAYLPTYTRVLKAGGREEARKFGSQIFTLLILSQIALLGLVYLDMPLLVRLTSPGFV